MRTLMRFERRWAHAMFETIFPGPPRGALPVGIADMDLDGFLDETFTQIPAESMIGLRITIWVVALSPLFVLRRFRSIAGLGVDDRERLLGALLTSRIYFVRQLLLSLKAIGSLLYCGDRALRKVITAGPPQPSALLVLGTKPASQNPDASGASHESFA
jgi:hypothetical protein